MQTSIMSRLLWGVVLVAVGIVFLLNQLGVITMSIGEFFATYWPGFMIFFGLQGMITQRGQAFWWNSILILLGCYFLGRNLDLLSWELGDMIRLLVPIGLILFGINMIVKGNRPPAKREENGHYDQWNPITPPTPPGPPPVPPEYGEFDRQERPADPIPPKPPEPPYTTYPDPDGDARCRGRGKDGNWKHHGRKNGWWEGHDWHNPNRIDYSRFIGDIHLGNDYWELRPTSISMFIGDTTLDLTKAQIPVGETRVYVSSFIGDVKVFLPNDMGIGIQVTSSCLIGDVKVLDQKRGGFFSQMSVETPYYADTDKRVILIVSSFIGDVRITKVG